MSVTNGSSGKTLSVVIKESEHAMCKAGYKSSTIRDHTRFWSDFHDFAGQRGQHTMTNELLEDWLSAKGYPVEGWPYPKPDRLSRMLSALRILVLVHEFGKIAPSHIASNRFRLALPTESSPVSWLWPATGHVSLACRIDSLPDSFREALRCYEQDCRERGCSPATLKNVRLYLPRFLTFLSEQGINSLEQVIPSCISEYVVSLREYAPGSVAQFVGHARCLLRFLYHRGMIPNDLSSAVPSCPIRNYRNIPTVWTPEETEQLLAQVDRGSPRGKRDYAILLLAAHLGMRVGDIIRLSLDDLKWEHNRIEIVQNKTRQPLVLPLLNEVGWAIIDYLKNARPISEYRRVFLSLAPPFGPFVDFDNLYHIITYYRRKAGIQRFKHQPVGMHTLRHSLATNLLADDTALHIISDVLGHACSESTGVYTKVNLPQLRRCAIDPEVLNHDTN